MVSPYLIFFTEADHMTFNLLFILNSILFGIGLAMDAFSVSVANGLRNPHMHTSRRMIIAGTFGCFQTVMPLLGWFCVHSIAEAFQAFQPYIPWIALVLLAFIGGKMIWEGLHDQSEAESLQGGALFIQGIATSIDALSVGFTIAEYELIFAVTESLIIGIVTFGLCLAGLLLGGRIGSRISGKAGIVGGIILILIGTEIFVTGII
jgi:putative Mn2+ efflux pump MntP